MENRLKYLTKFQKTLANYEISDENRKIMADIRLVVVLAPSSTGRNTIIDELLKTGEYYFIVSDTTRHKRMNNGVYERNGVHYWFRSEEDILADLEAGKYLEAEVIHNQQVSGMNISELQKAARLQKIAITDIDLQGAITVKKLKPDTINLLILPPSFDEWQRRLDNRGVLPSDEKRRRMETAVRIFETGLRDTNFVRVINDDFHNSVKKIHGVVFEGQESPDQQVAQQLLKDLLVATKEWLARPS